MTEKAFQALPTIRMLLGTYELSSGVLKSNCWSAIILSLNRGARMSHHKVRVEFLELTPQRKARFLQWALDSFRLCEPPSRVMSSPVGRFPPE